MMTPPHSNATAKSTATASAAARRLLRDLKEIEDCAADIHGIAAAPLEDDIFEWHANVLFGDDPLHLRLYFSESYPSEPPRLVCATRLPHPNIQEPTDGGFAVCLDMLEPIDPKKSRAYAGWSSGMTVLSILVQLQSFLADESLQYMAHGTVEDARRHMRRFDCGCGHLGERPWPMPPPPKARGTATKRLVCRPSGVVQLLTEPETMVDMSDLPAGLPPPMPPLESPDSSSPPPTSPPATRPPTPPPPPPLPPSPPEPKAAAAPTMPVALPPKASDAWQEVRRSKATPIIATANPFAVLSTSAHYKAMATKGLVKPAAGAHSAAGGGKPAVTAAAKPAAAVKPPPAKPATKPAVPLGAAVAEAPGLTKAQKKNLKRAEARKKEAAVLPTLPPPQKPTVPSTAVEVVASPSPSPPKPGAAPSAAVEVVAEPGSQEANAGVFALLGYDALLILLEKLHDERDVRALACCCRYLAGFAEDGLLWRLLFARHFPASRLSAASLTEWKHTFMLELSNSSHELCCFHTKQPLGTRRRHHSTDRDGDCDAKIDVLGLPLRVTYNPKTRELDYVYSSMDLLSASAFYDEGVRRSAWGEPFTHFLPLYLDAEHWEAALPMLRDTVRQLCTPSPSWRGAAEAEAGGKGGKGGRGGGVGRGRGRGGGDGMRGYVPFRPEMLLDVLPKLLTTMVVLICDAGVHASDALLDGYCQVNRLLIAAAAKYPQLRVAVTKRVRAFIADDACRTKAHEPSLGTLIPLLAIAGGVRWADLAWPLLEETFARGVLWACRAHPELERLDGVDGEQRLQWTWEERRVAARYLMFHTGFLARLSKVKPAELDTFHGRPSPWLRSAMRQHLTTVLSADSWPAFFATIRVPLPSKAQMVELLCRAVQRSEARGYHKKGMDFSRVHKSGVSAILRKGESCSASPTMHRLRLEEVWRYRTEETLFLDATALAYGFDGEPRAHVDYSQTSSANGLAGRYHYSGGGHRGGRAAAMRHSGDVIDGGKREGKHTIDINLRSLSDEVGALYFTLSGWTTSLREIVRPEVLCFDPDDKSGEPLCTYELEGKPTGSSTAVLMCKVWRERPGAIWHVTAIGSLGEGRASNYEPIHASIRAYEAAENNLLEKSD